SRPAVQSRFAETAAVRAVREATDRAAAQDADRTTFDRGRRARGARRRTRAAAPDPRISEPREAALDLHREAARAGQSAHRARAHLVSPGRGADRAPLFDRSEPAEHTDPHARGPPHPPGIHRPAGPRADG